MTFPWLDRTPRSSAAAVKARLDAQLREVRDRAALYFRLGYKPEDAIARITAAIAWEHEAPASGSGHRPDGLSDAAIADAVRETYARRPGGNL